MESPMYARVARVSAAISIFSLISVSVAVNSANGLSLEKKITLFAGEGSQTTSVESGPDGSIFVTLERSRPTLVKVNKDGLVLWSFEEQRESGIDKQFRSAVPLNDGSVVVCVSRYSMPGRGDGRQYPGAVVKLDANGKEMARYDPINIPENEWPFASAKACEKWGEDILLVADPARNQPQPPYMLDGEALSQNLAIRLRPDLSLVWIRPAPIYAWGSIVGPVPRARELKDGQLLFNGIDRAVILDRAGAVLHVLKLNFDLLVVTRASDAGPTQFIGHASEYGSPWILSTIADDLRRSKNVALQSPASSYSFFAAALTGGGLLALGGTDKDQQGDLLVFNANGEHLATHHFPDSFRLFRSQDRVLFVLPLENGVILVVTQSFASDVGTTVLTWLKIR